MVPDGKGDVKSVGTWRLWQPATVYRIAKGFRRRPKLRSELSQNLESRPRRFKNNPAPRRFLFPSFCFPMRRPSFNHVHYPPDGQVIHPKKDTLRPTFLPMLRFRSQTIQGYKDDAVGDVLVMTSCSFKFCHLSTFGFWLCLPGPRDLRGEAERLGSKLVFWWFCGEEE